MNWKTIEGPNGITSRIFVDPNSTPIKSDPKMVFQPSEGPFKTTNEDGEIIFPTGPVLRLDRMRPGFTWSPLPDKFHEYIGQVIIMWGQFDRPFNQFIDAMLKGNGTAIEPGWQDRMKRMDQRIDLFKKESKKAFGNMAYFSAALAEIIAETEKTQQARNLLAHGEVILEVNVKREADPNSEPVFTYKCKAKNIYKGKVVERDFMLEDLENLFYDMGNLLGLLLSIINHNPQIELPLHERLVLVDFLKKNLPPQIG